MRNYREESDMITGTSTLIIPHITKTESVIALLFISRRHARRHYRKTLVLEDSKIFSPHTQLMAASFQNCLAY